MDSGATTKNYHCISKINKITETLLNLQKAPVSDFMVVLQEFESIVKQINKTKAVILDGDNTLWKGRASKGIGTYILARELRKGHLITVLKGISGAKRVSNIAKSDSKNGDWMGLEEFYKVMSGLTTVTRSQMLEASRKYIRENQINEVARLVSDYNVYRPSFLITIAGSSVAQSACDILPLSGYQSNIDKFDSKERLTGVDIRIKNGSDKTISAMDLLRPLGIALRDCTVIGDSENDLELLSESGFSIASPLAIDSVKNNTNAQL